MKIWLDDIREPPDKTWTWAKSASDFNQFLFLGNNDIEEISFDHDIASYNVFGDEITGYHCLCAVEKQARYNVDFKIPKMSVHSANPVGRIRMEKVIQRMSEMSQT